MSSTTVYRASGLCLLLGALLGIIGNILNSALFPGNNPHHYLNGLWLATALLDFIGSLLVVLGLPGICARQAEKAGWLGLVGFALTIVGGILFTAFSAVVFLVFPWLAVIDPKLAAGGGPPAIFAYILVASLLFVVGGILLGIATIRAGIFPRWAGLLIIIGAVLDLAWFFPLPEIIISIVGTVGFVGFAVGMAWIGYALISPSSAEGVPPLAATKAAG